MKFKKAKELLAEELKRRSIERPKLFIKSSKGDFLNRLAYKIAKGELTVLKEEELGERIEPGAPIETINGITFLAFRGREKADSAIVKWREGKPKIELPFNYPDFAVDLSLLKRLTEKEIKSLTLQVELAFSHVRDYFTPENFFLISSSGKERLKTRANIKSYSYKKLENYASIVVLDPNAEEELKEEEIDEKTLIVVGGIVDSSERLRGATRELLTSAKHRKITYKGDVSIVPDRVNEIVKITLDYLTSELSLSEAVRKNLTRDSKLRFLRNFLQRRVKRFQIGGELFRLITEEEYEELIRDYEIGEFIFKKAARHVSGFGVCTEKIFGKVEGETTVRGKRVFLAKESARDEIVKLYP